MIKKLILTIVALIALGLKASYAQPDTVKVGAYVISIHDINFHDKEYTIRFWLWFLHKNPDFDFETQLDIPNAKDIDAPQVIKDSVDGRIWIMMKMKAVMKERWLVSDFPFDKQHLKVQIENSIYDKHSLVFVPDNKGSVFNPDEASDGWTVSNFKVKTGENLYETGFGDPRPGRERQFFSTFQIEMDIDRHAVGLFLKIFIGMYFAFMISVLSFSIHPSELEPRFGLPVGGLFAAVGNKYIIDSLLPETSQFTLVDTLHTLTFASIFFTLGVSALALHFHEKGEFVRSKTFNRRWSKIIIISYLLLNMGFVSWAIW